MSQQREDTSGNRSADATLEDGRLVLSGRLLIDTVEMLGHFDQKAHAIDIAQVSHMDTAGAWYVIDAQRRLTADTEVTITGADDMQEQLIEVVRNEDAQAPAVLTVANSDGTVNLATYDITGAAGAAEAGSTVTAYDVSDGTVAGTAVAAGDGSFAVTVDLVQDAVNGFYLTATDFASNESGASATLTVTEGTPVVVWGDNGSGQSVVPAVLDGVTEIAAGEDHSLALSADGTVTAWGDNGKGQSVVPAGLTDVTAIAAGQYHSLALYDDGS